MKKLFILLLSTAALLSCGKEPVAIEVSAGQVTRFKISEIDTKACLTDGYKICWEAGKDAVSIFSKSDNYRFIATTGGDGQFWLEGTIQNTNSKYYAVYPYNPDATNSTGCITTTLPSEQKAIPNQFSNIVAVASSNAKELLFQNCVTLVEVNLAVTGVNKISLRGNNGELVAGKIRMTVPGNPETGVPDPVITEGAKEASISDGGAELKPGTYYIAIAPQTFSKGITLTLSGENGSVEKTTANPVTATRSKRLKTGELSMTPLPYDSGFSIDWQDGDDSGSVQPGATKTIFYSYSGINSLSFTVHSNAHVNMDDGKGTQKAISPNSNIVYRLAPDAGSGGTSANNTRLQTSPRGSSSSPIDLSTDNNTLFGASLSGVNTANCYVVRDPGWYSFPLVYGNAIKNGAPNTNAYAPAVSGSTALSPFIDAYGSAISSPYINGSGAKAVSARIEWQDAPGLVAEEVGLVNDGGENDKIVFQVPSETIREGNAVISALDSKGGVVWSWHIWVCGASESELQPIAITNKAGNNYKFTRINLGWVAPYDSPVVYQPHETLLTFTQSGSGKTIEFKLLQSAAQVDNQMGNCPFYQWGRKDPFVASDGTPNTDPMADCIKKTWFKTSGRDTVGTRAMRLGESIAAYISHPSFYNKDSNGDGTYANLWNATQGAFASSSTNAANAEPVVKTVYDPCPVGTCLPPIGAWTAFTGDNALPFEQGYAFYSAPGKSGETTFYPATGSMSTMNLTSTKTAASLSKVGTGFSYWAANANNNKSGFNLNCYNGGAPTSTYGSNRQYVFPIRPCIEQ
ncbi:MAG: hypothetical protein IKZ51_04385 [Bacteroidales bacterium]|nr:hypothetical protein [Bacteroidales bacterium]